MDNTNGFVRIASDVVAIIAGIATLETEGVSSMSGGLAEGITKRLSGKQAQKGIYVEMTETTTQITVRLIMHYGHKIATVCRQVQINVKEAVETMTGLTIEAINIRVEGVDVPKEQLT